MTDPILLGLLRALSRRPFDLGVQGAVLDRAEEIGHPLPNVRSFILGTGLLMLWNGYKIVGRRGKRRILNQVRECLAYQTLMDEIALTDPEDDIPF